MRRAPALTLLAVPALVAGCTAAPPAMLTTLGSVHLRPFDGCEQLLGYYREQALDLVGPYGLDGGWAETVDVAVEDRAASGDDGGAAPSRAAEHSTTNTQEVGVDEPDIVKTDGRVVVTSVSGGVTVVDAATGRVLSRVGLGGPGGASSDRGFEGTGAELLLAGTDLVVLATEWGVGGPGPADTVPAFPPTRTVVTRIDLTDPSAPRVLGSVRLEGGYRSARMVGDAIRLVMVTEPPGLAFTHPEDGSMRAEAEAEAANRRIIGETTIEDWLPHRQVLAPDGTVQDTDRLLECTDVSRPRDPAGLSTLSVLTFDLSGDGVEPTSSVGLVATGDTVYASTDRLVVATSPWSAWSWRWSELAPGRTLRSDLHSFDISDPGRTDYVASGSVPGRLLNQFALDEEDGVIRVATTTDEGRGRWSQSSLVVLREEGDELVVTGQVDGLGVTEQIHAVRFLGPGLAAVVTFRQVDPLYLVDTSDPTAPTVLGELKVPGYSAYLHPLGENLLLGVGQDADTGTGAVRGLQVSLFDISDPRRPRRLDQVSWPGAHSTIEWDHRAFLHWAATGQVFLPAEQWSPSLARDADAEPEDLFTGVLSVQLDGRRLLEGPRASTGSPGSWGAVPLRTLVVGDTLWSLTHDGLSRHDLATMERLDVIPLG